MGANPMGFRLIPEIPDLVQAIPQLRFMGSKYRLLPWIYEILAGLEFDSALGRILGQARCLI
jgi:adenine-specific DNA-methyltransferase